MSNTKPQFTLEQDGVFTRVTMEYTPDALDAMAQRAAERIEDELAQQLLARLGYVKPVRCRDCGRFSVDQSDHEYRSGWWCSRWCTDMVEPDGFCAWGKRREDG